MEGVNLELINATNQAELKDEQILKVQDAIEESLTVGVKSEIAKYAQDEPVSAPQEFQDFSQDLHKFYVKYYEQFEIDPKRVNFPEQILFADTQDLNNAVTSLHVLDTILIGEPKQDNHVDKQYTRFRQFCDLAHEQYHLSAGSQYEVEVRGVDDGVDVSAHLVKSGLEIGESVDNSMLEEGLARRMEEIVSGVNLSHKFEGRSVTKLHIEGGTLEYEKSRKVIKILEDRIPNFIRLAERARLLDEIEPLANEIGRVFGDEIGEKVINGTCDNAGDILLELFRIQAAR